MRTGHTYWRSYILVNLGADSLPAAEQEVVDRVIRRKLQREYGGLRLESTNFRQFLTALGESAVKGRGSKDRADAGEFDEDSD
jgi:hypothetical protein